MGEKAQKAAEREARQAAWEATQAERKAAWEAKQAEKANRKAALQAWHVNKTEQKDWDVESESTEASTIATVTAFIVDEEEIERMVSADKVVRKFLKVLRDIEKLEGRRDLDALQKAKVARKPDIEFELNGAKGLARVRAREELKCQTRA